MGNQFINQYRVFGFDLSLVNIHQDGGFDHVMVDGIKIHFTPTGRLLGAERMYSLQNNRKPDEMAHLMFRGVIERVKASDGEIQLLEDGYVFDLTDTAWDAIQRAIHTKRIHCGEPGCTFHLHAEEEYLHGLCRFHIPCDRCGERNGLGVERISAPHREAEILCRECRSKRGIQKGDYYMARHGGWARCGFSEDGLLVDVTDTKAIEGMVNDGLLRPVSPRHGVDGLIGTGSDWILTDRGWDEVDDPYVGKHEWLLFHATKGYDWKLLGFTEDGEEARSWDDNGDGEAFFCAVPIPKGHTGGRWQFKINHSHSIKIHSGRESIASISGNINSIPAKKESNARLIAMAPAMLESMKKMIKAMLLITMDQEKIEWLQEHDPKALEQMQKALASAQCLNGDK